MRESFWVNPAHRKTLELAGLCAPSDYFTLGQVVRTVGNKQNVRIPDPSGSGETAFFLKRFSPDRASLGIRELENTRIVSSLGIEVPEPAAAGNSADGSFFACAAIEGGAPLDQWLAEAAASGRGPSRRERNRIISSVADIARKMHDSGYCHRDMYLCHFFTVDSEKPRLLVIDMQRVRKTSPFRMRWIVKDLAALNYSALEAFCSTADRMRFLRCYLRSGRLGRNARGFARKVARKTARIARHDSGKAPGFA